ncbi:alpha amylase N-terminal ig-like domain-containing protein [Escherichia coli]|uniref:alpha amylase N-terminal ig-like domain-containing protein n=1 Tax=Escherichia coli TaxID=562 RepID=UPI00255AD010|nr:alpha amylase N-terminal ig-like domain-containing protein [Escherichia coli]
MLNAWHLPVPPFVKQSKDQLLITLWLTGEDPPQRIMLRTEHDNEEMSVPMHKQRSQPQPGVTAWRAAIDLSSGQPRRRYSFKLLWHDRQRWFTPQGFSRMPPARLGSLPSMYRISVHNGLRIRFFIRSSLIVSPVVFLVKLNRIMSITITPPDKRSYCVTGMNRSRRRRADQRSMAAIWTG